MAVMALPGEALRQAAEAAGGRPLRFTTPLLHRPAADGNTVWLCRRAGLLYIKGFLRKTKESLSLFGFLSTLLLYGVIMNSSFVIQSQTNLNFSKFAASIASGFPFDLVHAISCAFFLWFLTEPLIEKTERVKEKYGLFCD